MPPFTLQQLSTESCKKTGVLAAEHATASAEYVAAASAWVSVRLATRRRTAASAALPAQKYLTDASDPIRVVRAENQRIPNFSRGRHAPSRLSMAAGEQVFGQIFGC